MLKRFILVMAIAAWTCVIASPLMAQPKKVGPKLVDHGDTLRQEPEPAINFARLVGMKVVDEAEASRQRAQSKEDLQKAVEKYEQALGIFERISEKLKSESPEIDKVRATALNGLGLIYCSWGEYEKAGACLNKAKGLVESNTVISTEIELTSSKLDLERGYDSAAWESYESMLDTLKEIGNLKGQADVLEGIAVLDITGQTSYSVAHARSNLEQALDIRRKIEDRRGEGITLNTLGMLFRLTGEPSKALECIEKALKIAQQTGNASGRAEALDNKGNVFMNRGEYVRAAEQFDKALAIRMRLGEVKGEATTLTNLGHVYMAQVEPEKALAFWERGLKILLKIGVPSDLPGHPIKSLLAELYLDSGEITKAERALELPTELQECVENIRDGDWDYLGFTGYLLMIARAGLFPSLAKLQFMKSDYPGAIKFYRAMRMYSEEVGIYSDLVVANTGLGLAWERLGELPKAANFFRQAIEYIEAERASLQRTGTEREKFFDVKIAGFARTAPYKGLARVLLIMNRTEEAIRQSEYTKARAFAEVISERRQSGGARVPKEVVELDSRLHEELADLTQQLQSTRAKPGFEEKEQNINMLEQQIKEMKERLGIHVRMLRDKYPLFAAVKYPEPMDLSQAALRENEWALDYDVTDAGLLIYLMKGKKVVKALFKPILQKQVDALVQEFRKTAELADSEKILDKVKRFDFPTAKKLADLLLGDVLPDLPPKAPLIIVPDGQLGLIPFEMLVLNTGGEVKRDKKIPYVIGAEFFGDRNPISYYQSVTALTLARTLGKGQEQGSRTLAMVDPVFTTDDQRLVKAAAQKRRAQLDSISNERLMAMKTEVGFELSRLPLTSQLGEALKKADPINTDLYAGLDAQKSLLFTRDLTPYKYCVFGTHGDMGEALPDIQEPVLFLTLLDQPEGQDGFLRMSEVMGLKMNADMVALTACQSGLGRTISGEGVMGMGRAFQYAGAKSVLMSLWSVVDKSSVMLTESFFKHLREGKNKLESLRLARDEIRKAGYDHPFFWAPFILVGEVD
jgi:tetratricopeptide (TPR) repeat protein